jgi:dTDP-4-dehydrorhamnose reductase
MNILVTGSNGQLGSEIKDLASYYKNFNFFFLDLPALDICNSNELAVYFEKNKISTVINCAAYTAVDNAEGDAALAEKVNSEGVLNLVNAVKKVDGKLIHVSTDYVFDGNSFLPYQEVDEVNPIGVYGNTKRNGELAVINSDIDAIVIRTSWLYSAYGNNFLKTMLRLGSEKEELGIIFDQVGTPTCASDLAKACLEILSFKEQSKISAKGNIYHFSNEGVASWFDFAAAIMDLGNIDCRVKPIETKDYITLARRPHFSVLNKTKIKNDFEIEIPYWRSSLETCLLKLKNL